MIAGSAELLKQHLPARIVVILQGDDLFLNSLDARHKRQALEEIHRIDRSVDRYLCHSRFYADRMAALLGVDRAKIRIVPLGIEVRDLLADDGSRAATARPTRPPTVGYLARLAPEKGLHLACEAVLALRNQPTTATTRLCVAGWRGESHRAYADEAMRRLTSLGANAVEYRGEVTRDQKRQFLADIDVLCVPSPYEEPKGLYVLEAMTAGVPVVSPRHGAFPEVIEETRGGRLFEPNNVADLTDVLGQLLCNHELRREIGQQGRQAVLAARTAEHYAQRVWHEFVALWDATNSNSPGPVHR
jgi:glycosyltransferase involved in cell wall biosynthesis